MRMPLCRRFILIPALFFAVLPIYNAVGFQILPLAVDLLHFNFAVAREERDLEPAASTAAAAASSNLSVDPLS